MQMKSVKNLFLFASMAISFTYASAQGNINDAIFFKAKYKKDKVWDVQRSPAFPVAGQNWRLSGLKGSLDARGTTVDWGQDRYVMLVAEPDNSNSANSLTNDVTGAGGKYKVALKLFESNGTLVRVVSSWGKIAGIGDKGFMYECEGQFGTFFSVAAVQQSAVIEYRPTLGVISRLSEIINPSDLTRSLEREYLVTESSFFSNKYVKDNVWDVQRSPAYPVAGQEWRLSGLKGSLDASGASVNWGNGRYVMLIAEADNTNNPNSLIDDINNTGTKLNISLKLYESNGALVQVVSKWGKIYGMGAEGFMYEVEGRFGTFFSVARVNASDVLRYRPNLGAITKLSELTKGLNAVKVSEPISVSSNPFSNAAFFNTKHTKEKVWDAQREPAFPVIGQDWTLKGLKPAMDASGARIDWGSGRYVMFVAEPDNARWANSIVDDVNKSGVKYNISLKLYESNGTLVKEISKWGRVIGIGDRGFMYETEGRYGTFFSVGGANAATVIRYKPSIATVVKLSELTGSAAKSSETVKVDPVKVDPVIVKEPVINPPAVIKGVTDAPLFTAKYTKERVWDVVRMPIIANPGKEWTLSKLKGALEASGSPIDWGNGRYVMFVAEVAGGGSIFTLADDVNNSRIKYNVSLRLFESDGTFVKLVSSWGRFLGFGDKGFIFEPDGKFTTFFSINPLSSSDVVKYTPSLGRITKLSELLKGMQITPVSEIPKGNITEKIIDSGRVTNSDNIPGMSKVTESENVSELPVKDNTKQEEVVKSNMPFDIYKIKFKKNQVWDAVVGETEDETKVAYVMSGPAKYEKSWDESGQIDWGKNNDRYMMFFLQKGEGRMPIIDDINNDEPTLLSVKMFEATGKPIGETYRCGIVKNVGPNGFIYFIASSEHQFNIYFSKTPLKVNDTLTYTPIKIGNGLNRMSELQFGTVVTQNDKLRKALSIPGGISSVVSKHGLSYGKMTDQDGNTYKTITIGTQTWMAENLRVTKYRNGELIPIVNISRDWDDRDLNTGALCSYENTTDKNKVATTGLLYNWYAVTDKRNIAPEGWHVPTAEEWATLVNTLGGENLAGGKMKEAGTAHWISPNNGATNESGFNASPAGLRSNEQGRFGELKSFAGYWTSTINPENEDRAFFYVLRNEDSNCTRDYFPFTYAISIRLVKD
jgi:uncharacterized protein (TIGR02145 family)